MLRKIIAVLAVVVMLAAAGLLFLTRDFQPTHSALRQTDLPPLIPTRSFFADTRAAFAYVASSDGVYLAHQQAGITGLKLVVRERSSWRLIAEYPSAAVHVRWHPTEAKLRFIYDGHDWESDIFNPAPENWIRTSPVKLSGGWIKQAIATSADDKVLVRGKSHPREPSHLWRVSQDGFEAEQVAEGDEKTLYWVLDETSQPALRFEAMDPATRQVYHKENESWQPLLTFDIDDHFYPVSPVREDKTVLMVSARGRDKAALVSLDLDTLQETIILENSEADIGDSYRLTPALEADIISLGLNTTKRHALTENGRKFLHILDQLEQPVMLGSIQATAAGRYATAAVSPAGKSWIYLLVDLQEGSYELINEYSFRRYKDSLVTDQEVTFTARDGLVIPAILMLPKDPAGPIPFIIEVHGGPAGAVGRDYHHNFQFLVNRGYGVLSVNFRGSTGFGKQFQSAGFRQFGRAMQDDLTDAANWLVQQKLADPDNLAIMGTSYGGYAAALAMTRDPGLFDAAIVEFPMLDPEFQTRYHPGFWEQSLDGWSRYFGTHENEEDLKFMREFSPLNRVGELHGPMLLLAGLRDQITAAQQVRDYQSAADNAGKDVSVHYFPEAGHGLDHWADRLTRARLIEDFLAEKIGGRSGGFELVELATEFVD